MKSVVIFLLLCSWAVVTTTPLSPKTTNITTSKMTTTTEGAFVVKDQFTMTTPMTTTVESENKTLTTLLPLLTTPYDDLRSSTSSYVVDSTKRLEDPWPIRLAAELPGDLILGGLMMVHEREDASICGKVMPQGGIQALEAMLYTLDRLNASPDPPFILGAHILDDCDRDTYGLEMAVDFIKVSNTTRKRLESFQSKVLRLAVGAPWFVRKSQLSLRRELGVDSLEDLLKELTL